jgi:hypothetical protein
LFMVYRSSSTKALDAYVWWQVMVWLLQRSLDIMAYYGNFIVDQATVVLK